MERIPFFFQWTLILFFIFDIGLAMAQTPQDDVVYVKNGWILRGTLLASPADSLVKIQTFDQNIFVFTRNEIQDIRREPTLRNFNIRYRKKGFAHYTELGALASRNTTSNQTTTSAFTFHMVNGYKFNPYLFTGLGAGVDLYATQTFVPVFASIRGDIYYKTNLIPYYYVDGGYGFNATANTDDAIRFIGGLHFAAGIGLKILFNNNAGFLLSAGYYLQETATEIRRVNSSRRQQNYERVAIRAGFSF